MKLRDLPFGRRVHEHGETFYGSRLRVARMRRGLSIAELEATSGVNRGRLHRYQSDRQTPSREDVEEIAAATGFPIGFFYLGEAPMLDIRTTSLL